MGVNGGRQLASKWLKTKALLGHPSIAAHIPPTDLYTPSHLFRMIEQYGTVVLKPIRGGGGNGLIRISRRRGKGFAFDYQARRSHCGGSAELLRAVNSVRHGRPYLIQKGIDLAEVHGRPIDYRVKYVHFGDRWHIRAMVGRVARRGLFVTNLCRGGKLLPAAHGLRASLSSESVAVKKKEMRELTKLCTSVLERKFPGIRQLGYDYGIDRGGHIWILEVNTRPQ